MRALPITALITLLALPTQAQTPPTSAFDGTWSVTFTCPATADGIAGYTRRFLAAVQNGLLHGEVGVRNQASYLAFDGRIGPDGRATLLGQGMTGSPDYAVGRPRPATPYSFPLLASFTPTNGIGHRTEVRPCDAVFTRQ